MNTYYWLNSSFQADSPIRCDSNSDVVRAIVQCTGTKAILESVVMDVIRRMKIQRLERAFQDGHPCFVSREIVGSIPVVQDKDLGMDHPLVQEIDNGIVRRDTWRSVVVHKARLKVLEDTVLDAPEEVYIIHSSPPAHHHQIPSLPSRKYTPHHEYTISL